MITHFEPSYPLEPENPQRLQWRPAFLCGLIAGGILLLVPRGSPWSALTFFSPVIMGRALPAGLQLPLLWVWLIHLAVSIVYGLIIARIIASLRQERAILTGGVIGLVLYVANFGIISTWWPQLRGNEVSVVFTHVVFGLLAAGGYRGLLRRKAA